MLVTVIAAADGLIAKRKIQQALAFPIDGIELRLDYFNKIDIIHNN